MLVGSFLVKSLLGSCTGSGNLKFFYWLEAKLKICNRLWQKAMWLWGEGRELWHLHRCACVPLPSLLNACVSIKNAPFFVVSVVIKGFSLCQYHLNIEVFMCALKMICIILNVSKVSRNKKFYSFTEYTSHLSHFSIPPMKVWFVVVVFLRKWLLPIIINWLILIINLKLLSFLIVVRFSLFAFSKTSQKVYACALTFKWLLMYESIMSTCENNFQSHILIFS